MPIPLYVFDRVKFCLEYREKTIKPKIVNCVLLCIRFYLYKFRISGNLPTTNKALLYIRTVYPSEKKVAKKLYQLYGKWGSLWSEVESRTQGSRPRPRTQKKSEAKDSPSEITWIWTEKRLQFQWGPFFSSFLWRSPKFGQKNDSIWLKTDQNVGQAQDLLMLFPASKKKPHCKFLPTRLSMMIENFDAQEFGPAGEYLSLEKLNIMMSLLFLIADP